MFHISQCVHVPAGASGSSAISANAFVDDGASVHRSRGETSCPSHVKVFGIVPTAGNDIAEICKVITLPVSGAVWAKRVEIMTVYPAIVRTTVRTIVWFMRLLCNVLQVTSSAAWEITHLMDIGHERGSLRL